MSLDHALFLSMQQGSIPGFFRLYLWNKPSITVGRNQSTEWLDFNRIQAENIQVVRRITGGKAIYHHRELTFSIGCPVHKSLSRNLALVFESLFEWFSPALNTKDLSYTLKSRWIEKHKAYEKTGSHEKATPPEDCFDSTTAYEVVDQKGRKRIGSALLIKNGFVLQQSSFPQDSTYLDLKKYEGTTLNTIKIEDETLLMDNIKISKEELLLRYQNFDQSVLSTLDIKKKELSINELANFYYCCNINQPLC